MTTDVLDDPNAKLTIRQKVLVAKDRAGDELATLLNDANGYWNLKPEDKKAVERIARFLGMPDSRQTTLDEAEKLCLLNGEEYLFWEPA